MIAADVDAFAAENKEKAVFVHVDVDNCEGTAQKYAVTAMPTTIVLKGGAEHGSRVVGASVQKIKELAQSAF